MCKYFFLVKYKMHDFDGLRYDDFEDKYGKMGTELRKAEFDFMHTHCSFCFLKNSTKSEGVCGCIFNVH